MSIEIKKTDMPGTLRIISSQTVQIDEGKPVDTKHLSEKEIKALNQYLASSERLRIQSMVVDG